MSDFDDKQIPAGEISDNSDNDTEVRVSSPDDATNRNRNDANMISNEGESASGGIDPPPSVTGPPSRESSADFRSKKDMKSDLASGTTDDQSSVNQSIDLLGPLVEINPSATDTSILSVDPDGVCPSHRHNESIIFSDRLMDNADEYNDTNRDSSTGGKEGRSPSPLSDEGNDGDEEGRRQQAASQAKKAQINSQGKQKSNQDKDEEKKSPDKLSPLRAESDHKHAKDPFSGTQTQFLQESPTFSKSQDSLLQSDRSYVSSFEHRDYGLPHTIYHTDGNHHSIHELQGLSASSLHTAKPIPQLTTYPSHQAQRIPAMGTGQMLVGGGKRKIHLRLLEDVPPDSAKKVSFLSFHRRKRSSQLLSPRGSAEEDHREGDIDRGRVTVSWYDGTTSLELYEHVRNSVIRKLGLSRTERLTDLRILDEAFEPPEEIVLSPFIPNGSRLLLRFSISDKDGTQTPLRSSSYNGGAPLSPSAAPSPYRSTVDLNGLGLNHHQLALLSTRLKGLETPSAKTPKIERKRSSKEKKGKTPVVERKTSKELDDVENDDLWSQASTTLETNSLHPEDQIEKNLRQITELLIADRATRDVPRQEKRQVVVVLAFYFLLFLSLIAISEKIQARVPQWHASIEQQLKNVQNCSKDEDSLYECVSKGDLAGLVASVVLWISRSAATRRIFLFGFESPMKLWSVVYESLVTAVCWGFSYMFIRRGMNPDTSERFLQKYWKDAVYGSLAGFNAAFMKHVLKNLIPQEAIEDVLMQDRKLKILSWFKDFA
eukprot:scaffold1525_cov142-Cylindrotheca_fusiformis.AAC.102